MLAVVLFHAAGGAFPNGYLGVDAFFVISGFVVTPLLVRMVEASAQGRAQGPLGLFISRRVRRLTPAMGTMLLGTSLLLVFFMPVGGYQADPAKLGLTAIALGANFGAYAFAGDYFQHIPNPLIHTWSLSVEEQIYLFLPLVLVLALQLRIGTPHSLTRGTLLAAGATSIAVTAIWVIDPTPLRTIGVTPEHANSFLFYSTTSRIWEFCAGGLAALALRTLAVPTTPHWLSGAASISLTAILLTPIPLGVPFPLAEAGAALLTMFTLFFSGGGAPKWTRPLQWLGDRSYSVYLWHMPLIVVAVHSPVVSARQGGTVTIAAAIAATLLAGAASYRLVEQRYRVRDDHPLVPVPIIRVVAAFAVVPAFALASLGFAARHQFWGLNGGHGQLPLAWNIDQRCERMNNASFVPCWYGAADGWTVLLAGDSHAAAISQAFVDASLDAGARAAVQTRSFCPLIDVSALTPGDQMRVASALGSGCLKHNASTLETLRHSRIQTLVVSSRSSAGYGELFGPDGNEFFRSVTQASLDRVRGMVASLIIVGPVAEFPDVNFGRALFQGGRQSPLNADELPPQPFADERHWQEFAARRNAVYISAIDTSCEDSRCRYTDYLDATHLNLEGARRLQPALRGAFASTLRTAPSRSAPPPPSSTGPTPAAD